MSIDRRKRGAEVSLALWSVAHRAVAHLAASVAQGWTLVYTLVLYWWDQMERCLAATMAAPSGSAPPFVIAQGAVLVLFIIAGILSERRFHPVAAW